MQRLVQCTGRLHVGAKKMLAFKLLLVPAFLLLISLAGKRWGAGVAGWLAGFPVVAGPILFFIAVDGGAVFAAQAATHSLAGIFGLVIFGSTYSRCCQRRSWPVALAAALLAWLVATELIALSVDSPWLAVHGINAIGAACFFAGISLALAPWLFPRIHAPPHSEPLPKFELAIRMIAGAALTWSVTVLADRIGPAWSGLLTVFPVMGIVLAVFSHRANGPQFTGALFRGMSTALWSFVLFCLVLAFALRAANIATAFAAALSLALVAHALARWLTLRAAATKAPVMREKV